VPANTTLSKPTCHVNLATEFGGGERQTELLVRQLGERGWRQRLVVRHEHPLCDRCSDVEGLEIRTVTSNPLAAALATRGSALVHAHEARGVYSGWIGSILFGIPYVMTRRVVNPQKKSGLRGRAYRRATRVVAISHAAANEMRKQHPDLEPDVISDAHADFVADAAAVAEIRARYPDKTLIGHIGVLEHGAKGQLTIIDAARKSARLHPNWHFLLLGSGGDEARFREAMSGLDNIELLGFVNNVGDYLAAFQLFVYPSLREAVGSTLLDAMQFGLPIVATNVGGIPEIIDDGTNGRLVEPERSDQLLAAITAILDDPAELQRMRVANQKKSALFSAGRMADAYEAIYRSIV